MSVIQFRNLPRIHGEIPIVKFLTKKEKLALYQAVGIIYDIRQKKEKLIRKLKETYVFNESYLMLISDDLHGDEKCEVLIEGQSIYQSMDHIAAKRLSSIRNGWKHMHNLYREMFINGIEPLVRAIWNDSDSLGEVAIVINQSDNGQIHSSDLKRLLENENLAKFFRHLRKMYGLNINYFKYHGMDFLCTLFNSEVIHEIYLYDQDENMVTNNSF